MGKRNKGNNDGTAHDVTRVFFGDCLVTLALSDPSNGFGCGCGKDIVSGSCLQRAGEVLPACDALFITGSLKVHPETRHNGELGSANAVTLSLMAPFFAESIARPSMPLWKAAVISCSLVAMVSVKAQEISSNSMPCSPKQDYTLKAPPLMEIPSRRSISVFSGLRSVFSDALSMFNAKDCVGVGEIPNAPMQSISENCSSI
jgi:hypothetical protein